ncbi:MAG: galactose oxidase-like domain-containing protein [Kineosporiaceae bacterium]
MPRRRRTLPAAVAGLSVSTALALGAGVPASAQTAVAASGSRVAPSVATDADLATTAADYTPDAMFAVEAQLIGIEHAREHQAQRNLAKRLGREGKVALPLAQGSGNGAASKGAAAKGAAAKGAAAKGAAADPAVVGKWSDPFVPEGTSVEAIGVHAALFHTGKVLLFGGYYDDDDETLATAAYLWDPATGAAKEVDPPRNTFCAGQTFLQDGSLLVVGGRLSNDVHPTPGTPYTLRFDPVSETWLEEPDTVLGRYYPTATELPDGRVLVTSGNTTTGKLNRTVEVFTPGTGGAQGSYAKVGPDVPIDLYPKQYVMPDGKVLVVQHKLVTTVDPATWEWASLPPLSVVRKNNPSSVLLPAGPGGQQWQMFLTGGAQTQRGGTTAKSEILDLRSPAKGWRKAAPMPNPRTHMGLVHLPDGTLLGVGGNSDDRFGEPQKGALRYDPATDTWTKLASQAMRRAYHSTALLLPDGRVLSAGDTGPGGGGTRLEVFSPPYLFAGPRPVIASTSATQLGYGDALTVTLDRAAGPAASRAVLISPSAVTHSDDMSSRFVELAVTRASDASLTLAMPASAVAAQPGWAMLFVLDASGVPSTASWVHLGPMSYGG